jgi:HAT1-interacting factor 1
VLFGKRLEAANEPDTESKGKEEAVEDAEAPALRHIKERLADTHDLLAEISLENER